MRHYYGYVVHVSRISHQRTMHIAAKNDVLKNTILYSATMLIYTLLTRCLRGTVKKVTIL